MIEAIKDIISNWKEILSHQNGLEFTILYAVNQYNRISFLTSKLIVTQALDLPITKNGISHFKIV